MTQRTFEINIQDLMGFLRFYMGRGEQTGELAPFLSGTLAQWMQNNPEQRIIAFAPIRRDVTLWSCTRVLNGVSQHWDCLKPQII